MPQPEQKTYAPASVKQITFQQSGKTILKIGVNVEKFIAFLQQHKNAKGYVNLGISARKETSQYGETHTMWLDTWQPSEKPRQQPAASAATPYSEVERGGEAQPEDVPF